MKLALIFLLFSGAAFAGEQKVTIENIKFTPDTLVVHKGDTVVWENKDLVSHTVTGELHGHRIFDSKEIKPGGKFKWKVKGNGEIEYKCTLHPVMNAKLTVK